LSNFFTLGKLGDLETKVPQRGPGWSSGKAPRSRRKIVKIMHK